MLFEFLFSVNFGRRPRQPVAWQRWQQSGNGHVGRGVRGGQEKRKENGAAYFRKYCEIMGSKAGRPQSEGGARLARYAARYGCSIKTARAHREGLHTRWVEFVATDGGEPSVEPESGAGCGAGGSGATGTLAELQHRQEMTQAALRQWRENARGYDEAQRQRCGADTLRKWEGAVSRSQTRYEASLAAEQKLRVQMGMLIPYEKVKELQRELGPLALLVRGMKDLVARGISEPAARAQFFAAFRAAENAWDSEVEQLNEKIQRVLPCF